MKIGIISAMEEEISDILNEAIIEEETNKASMKFILGNLHSKEVVLVVCGIGKVNAAICTQILVDDFHVDIVINVGVAGGLSGSVSPGDVVVADTLVQHDVDTSYFGDAVGQVPRLDTFDFKCDKNLVEAAIKSFESIQGNKCFVGRIVTGDQFIHEKDKIIKIANGFSAMACEMEGGSIAQTCYLNKIPFVVIRSISDNSITGKHMDYIKFKDLAIANSVLLLNHMLKMM